MPFSAVGIIPARWGSTRFPGKPLHVIAGKPLLQHVWERSCHAKTLDQVIVATDDMRIAEAAFAFGAEVALTSRQHQSGMARAAEVAAKAPSFTHVINVQGDEPLIEPALIDRLVRELKRDPALQMVTAAHPFEHKTDVASPHQVKVVLDGRKNALYFSRSAIPFIGGSEFPHLRHQGIYGYTRDLLLRLVRWRTGPLERAESLEQLRALENRVTIRVLVTGSGSPGVDTPADAEAVEQQLLSAASSARRKKRSHAQ